MNPVSDDLQHLENLSIYNTDMTFAQPRQRANTPPQGPGLATPSYVVPNEANQSQSVIIHGIPMTTRYDGTKDPLDFIIEYESIAKANKWSKEMMFHRLINCLEGAPKVYYLNQMELDPEFNYDKFRRGLIEKYTNICDGMLSPVKIMRRKQEPGESFNSYFENKLALIQRYARNMSEADKVTQIVNGLEDECQSLVIQKIVAKPERMTLDKLYKFCKQVYDSKDFNFPRVNVSNRRVKKEEEKVQEPSTSAPNQGRQDAEFTKLYNKINNLSQQLNTLKNREKQVQGPGRGRGYNSNYDQNFNQTRSPNSDTNARKQEERKDTQHQTGNVSQQERLPRQRRDRSQIMCYRCGELGHYANECQNNPNPTVPKNVQSQN